MSKFESHIITINKTQDKKRLDQALTVHLIKYSRSQVKILILNKNVKNHKDVITESSYKVKEGEVFTVKIPIIDQPKYDPKNIQLDIIFEDKDIIVINKPAGIVTHPSPGHENNTLVNALLYYTKNHLSNLNIDRPGIVHRLDKDTSGLLVIAKNELSHINLSLQFKEHTILRKYYAIVWGIPTNQIITGYIQRHKINRKKMMLNKQNGKYSETMVKLIKSYNICSLVECTLKTGRTHQVRLHMTSINSPIIGDQVYGRNKKNKYGKILKDFSKFLFLKDFNRQALHAYKLGFNHPITDKYLEFKVEIPQDMLKLQEYLVKY